MPDDFVPEPAAMAAPHPAQSLPGQSFQAQQPRRGGGTILLGLLVAFLLGAAGVVYATWQGLIPMPGPAVPKLAAIPAPGPTPGPAPAPAQGPVPAGLAGQQDQLEARVQALAARLDTLTVQAQAASGNASRAEALLVAFAARRALDRGAPLNTLEDQLRLRFGDSQPHAVATVIEAARQPVTLDQLVAGLDSLAPTLTRSPAQRGFWSNLRSELGGLFVIRHEATVSPAPATMLERARMMLESGRTGEAIDIVERLPGDGAATDWFTAARRYDDARRALDVLETAAMIGSPAGKSAAGAAPSPQPTA